MAEIYNKIDTDKYFDPQSPLPALEYVNSDIITDFENKSVVHGLAEIWLCRSGTGEMQIESERRKVRENDFWIMNPYTLHCAYAKPNETTEFLVLGIRNVKFGISEDLSNSWFRTNDNKLRTYMEFIFNEAKFPGDTPPRCCITFWSLPCLKYNECTRQALCPSKRKSRANLPTPLQAISKRTSTSKSLSTN